MIRNILKITLIFCILFSFDIGLAKAAPESTLIEVVEIYESSSYLPSNFSTPVISNTKKPLLDKDEEEADQNKPKGPKITVSTNATDHPGKKTAESIGADDYEDTSESDESTSEDSEVAEEYAESTSESIIESDEDIDEESESIDEESYGIDPTPLVPVELEEDLYEGAGDGTMYASGDFDAVGSAVTIIPTPATTESLSDLLDDMIMYMMYEAKTSGESSFDKNPKETISADALYGLAFWEYTSDFGVGHIQLKQQHGKKTTGKQKGEIRVKDRGVSKRAQKTSEEKDITTSAIEDEATGIKTILTPERGSGYDEIQLFETPAMVESVEPQQIIEAPIIETPAMVESIQPEPIIEMPKPEPEQITQPNIVSPESNEKSGVEKLLILRAIRQRGNQ